MPEPTNTPSTPSCIISAASAGVAMPPAEKLTTGQPALLGDHAHELDGRAELLRLRDVLLGAQGGDLGDVAQDLALVADGLDDVAGAGLALRADHGGAFGDAAQRLTEVARAAHERHRERPLVDVELLVGGRQHLGLVDVVDAERLQDLRLHEMADARLRHDRDRDGLLDLLDLGGVGHAGDAAVATDVGGNPLERHDGARAGVLGDLRLVGGGDVHDDAALEHLGQAGLHGEAAGLALHGVSPPGERSPEQSSQRVYRRRTGGPRRRLLEGLTSRKRDGGREHARGRELDERGAGLQLELIATLGREHRHVTFGGPRPCARSTSLPSRSSHALPVPVTSTSGRDSR